MQTDHVISVTAPGLSEIGSWAVEMKDGQEPRMTADAPMMRLLGLETKAEMSPEKLYRAWRDRVSESHQGAVDETFGYMLRGEPAEMRYLWNHPDGWDVIRDCHEKSMREAMIEILAARETERAEREAKGASLLEPTPNTRSRPSRGIV